MPKLCDKYYFSVEGQTEKLYLAWLQREINQSSVATRNVRFDVKVEKDPVSRVKGMQVSYPTEVFHLCDYESSGDEHQKKFLHTIDKMKKATRLGKAVTYRLGYSNFSFELWLLLHLSHQRRSLSDRNQYLAEINRVFDEKFESLDELKKEETVQRMLKRLNLQNVIEAVKRAQAINTLNVDNGYCLIKYKGYQYYRENPSLSLDEIFEKILLGCGLILKK